MLCTDYCLASPKAKYPSITFYRDWVVHTKLDRSAVADTLVRRFDDYVTSNNATASSKLKELVSPLALRQELTKYLTKYDLTFPGSNDGVLWKRFVKYLAGVIDETPLHLNKHGNKKTNYVKSVTVSRTRNQNGTAMLTWEALCHTLPPAGVGTNIEVVLLPDFDQIALP